MPSRPTSDKPPTLTKAEALAAISKAETLLSDLLASPSLERSAYQRGRGALNGLRAAREALIMETAARMHAMGKEARPRITTEEVEAICAVKPVLTGDITYSYTMPWTPPATPLEHLKAIAKESASLYGAGAGLQPPAPSTVYCHRCRARWFTQNMAQPYLCPNIGCTSPLQAEHWDAKPKAEPSFAEVTASSLSRRWKAAATRASLIGNVVTLTMASEANAIPVGSYVRAGFCYADARPGCTTVVARDAANGTVTLDDASALECFCDGDILFCWTVPLSKEGA